jgi:hypothetical protein
MQVPISGHFVETVMDFNLTGSRTGDFAPTPRSLVLALTRNDEQVEFVKEHLVFSPEDAHGEPSCLSVLGPRRI